MTILRIRVCDRCARREDDPREDPRESSWLSLQAESGAQAVLRADLCPPCGELLVAFARLVKP